MLPDLPGFLVKNSGWFVFVTNIFAGKLLLKQVSNLRNVPGPSLVGAPFRSVYLKSNSHMKHLTKILIILFVALLASSAEAQDVIHKKNGKTIEAKIVELGTTEIKYRQFSEPDGPIYVEEKENITKIVFQDGRTEFYGTPRMDDAAMFEGQKKSAIKISFLGPLLGYTNILYERNIKPGRSWEVKAGIIGLGKQYDDKAVGFLGSWAYKFYRKPDFHTAEMKRTHILQGGYLKPEIFAGYSSFYDVDDSTNNEKESHGTFGLLLNIGKQWVFDSDLVLDLAFGIGYGGGESRRSIYVVGDSGFAGNFTLNLGWTIK